MSRADPAERFLVQLCPEVEPTLHRAGDLGPFLQRVAEAAHYGLHDDLGDTLRLWRWAAPGVLEELQVACVEPAAFDADDYAEPVWAALGRDGTAYIAIPVRIDGRA